MQRSPSHTAAVALVGVSTVGGGALAATDSDLPGIEPGFALPIVCATAAALAFMRRYATIQEQRMRTLFTGLARQHDERERDLDARERALARREESFRRTELVTQLRVNSVYARLDMANAECRSERERRIEVEGEYRELCREYNDVVLEVADAAPPQEADRPPLAVGEAGHAVHSRGPRRLYMQRHGPRPYLTVVDDQDSA